jgi:hypothetical protein
LEVDPSSSTDGASHRDEDEYMDACGSVVIPEDEHEGERTTSLESDEEGGSVVIPDSEEEGTVDESGDYLDEEDTSDPGDEEERDEEEEEEQVAILEMYGECQDVEYYQ